MAAPPSLVVAIVNLESDVEVMWLPRSALQRLAQDLSERIAEVLGETGEMSQLLNTRIDGLYVKPAAALVALAEYLHFKIGRTLITVGDDSVRDEEETQALMSENQCDAELLFTNLEAENLEVSPGQKLNVWISTNVPLNSKDSWRIVEINVLKGLNLSAILSLEQRPSTIFESVIEPQIPEPKVEDNSLELLQDFVTSLRKAKLLVPLYGPSDSYDIDELLVRMLKATYNLFKTTARKLVEIVPKLAPGKPVSTKDLEAVLSSVSLPDLELGTLPPAQSAASLSADVSELSASYTRLSNALKLGLEGLDEQVLTSPSPALCFNLQPSADGNATVILVNQGQTPARNLSVQFLGRDGSLLSQNDGISVEANNQMLCVSSEQMAGWKAWNLGRIQVVGTEVFVDIP